MKLNLDVIERINSIDFSSVIYSIVEKDDGPRWAVAKALRAEKQYRQFLYIHATNPEICVVPSKLVDEFWHQHMLDSFKYAEDCNSALGHFLHHFPYLGTGGATDRELLRQSYLATTDLTAKVFGCDDSVGDESTCGGNCSHSIETTQSKLIRPTPTFEYVAQVA